MSWKRLAVALAMVWGLSVPGLEAQTVDPCQYGCPKAGCPQCPDEGGPIEKQTPPEKEPACSKYHFECKASDENGVCVQHEKVCDN